MFKQNPTEAKTLGQDSFFFLIGAQFLFLKSAVSDLRHKFIKAAAVQSTDSRTGLAVSLGPGAKLDVGVTHVLQSCLCWYHHWCALGWGPCLD